MNKLVSLTPENIAYIKEKAMQMGYKKGFSQSLNKIVDEHKTMADLKKMKNDILELKHGN